MNGGGVKLGANCPDDVKILTCEKTPSSVSFWSELPVKESVSISGAAMPHASGQRFLALMSTYFIEY